MFRTYARMAPQVLRALLQRSDGLRVSRVRSRVYLDQVDFFGHMNQARYAEQFEVGRTDLVIRSGAWKAWRDDGVYPVVARQEITYRRELKPLQRFVMDSRAVGYEGRLLHIRGLMLVGDRVHARNDAFMIFIGPDGVLGEDEVRIHGDRLVTEPLAVDDWRVAAS